MIPRGEVVNRLREANFAFKRKGDRVEIYRQKGTGQRVNITLRDLLTEMEATVVLHQAGLTGPEIAKFIAQATKRHKGLC